MDKTEHFKAQGPGQGRRWSHRTKSPSCPSPLLPHPQLTSFFFLFSFFTFSAMCSLTGSPEALNPKQRVQEGGCSVHLPCRPHSPPVWTCSGARNQEIAQRRHLTWGVHTPPSTVTLQTLCLVTTRPGPAAVATCG